MSTIRIISALFAVFSFGFSAFVAEIHADTHTAASCSYSDVSIAITAASPGDTVLVPSGSCTWSSTLTITKDVSLIGPGKNNLVITLSGNPGLYYNPNYSVDTDNFRLSGFEFTTGACPSNGLMQIGNDQNNPTANENRKKTKFRVDNNIFRSTGSCSNEQPLFWIYKGVYGVVDNNEMYVYEQVARSTEGGAHGGDVWIYWAYYPGMEAYDNFGQGNTIYFEDNTIQINSTGGDNIIQSSQGGHRYAYRYNDISLAGNSLWYVWDGHGNESSGSFQIASTIGMEIYGNDITIAGASDGGMQQHRGGQGMYFNNNLTSSASYYWVLTEKHADSDGPGPATHTITGQPQHVWKTYIWGSRKNLTGALFLIDEHEHVGDIPLIDSDFWVANTWDESGGTVTSGVGCGTEAQKNAITTCSEGVGFWQTDQSCTNLTGMVGVHPTTPLEGSLYICDDSNTWVEYYTPFTYPHPLRLDAPAAPKNLHIINIK